MTPIGSVYILCNARDVWLARISAASVRFWHPEIRVTLVKDLTNGDFDCAELETVWDCESIILDHPRCAYFAKILLLTREIRERFLYLDADTICCGPILAKLEAYSGDFVVPERSVTNVYSNEFTELYYSYSKVRALVSDFPPPTFAFNSGSFVGTSGLLTRKHFDDYLRWQPAIKLKHPDIFSPGDQGLLNFVLTDLHRREVIHLEGCDYMIWGWGLRNRLVSVCDMRRKAAPAWIVHYAGRKPVSPNRFARADLLAFFEQLYYSRVRFGRAKRSVRRIRRQLQSIV